jgi:hypothetical protein
MGQKRRKGHRKGKGKRRERKGKEERKQRGIHNGSMGARLMSGRIQSREQRNNCW